MRPKSEKKAYTISSIMAKIEMAKKHPFANGKIVNAKNYTLDLKVHQKIAIFRFDLENEILSVCFRKWELKICDL